MCVRRLPAFGDYFVAHPPKTKWEQGRHAFEPIALMTVYRGRQTPLSAVYCCVCYSSETVRAAVDAAEAVRSSSPTKDNASAWREAIKKLQAVIIDNPFDADLHLACDMHTSAVQAKALESSKVPNSGAAVPVAAGDADQRVRDMHASLLANTAALGAMTRCMDELQANLVKVEKALAEFNSRTNGGIGGGAASTKR